MCQGINHAGSVLIFPVNLKNMASSIAKSYGDKGAIVITMGDEGIRIGVCGLDDGEVQDALCNAIYYNFCVIDGIVSIH